MQPPVVHCAEPTTMEPAQSAPSPTQLGLLAALPVTAVQPPALAPSQPELRAVQPGPAAQAPPYAPAQQPVEAAPLPVTRSVASPAPHSPSGPARSAAVVAQSAALALPVPPGLAQDAVVPPQPGASAPGAEAPSLPEDPAGVTATQRAAPTAPRARAPSVAGKKRKECEADGCTIVPVFNFPGEASGCFCKTHW